ncbi:MAG: hypothetical protein CMG37_05370 [Candidatus Marinimicrobia bacterium]|jgi:uncharacterized membrane protein YGL010W|nr:hypothetical protein [Candidatus Neomarinimicrobiota bacterium]MBS00830.1 hypothetical protein [Candidatus Neomarinimicrobiota bacterium]MEC7935071.1 hypothetical protein [Candidatus Neomarinimicrobiota bacterium]MED5266008.1 hypothetical protein [Candidatus Neomarinimicrobiota bacterium]|tara:strand:+ start:1240 stop:1437 length:198 start_codon:yes stop_codon:yes gene_type:complete
MISIKTFHIFFIIISIILFVGYGVYEMNNPTFSGSFSFFPSVFSFFLAFGLIFYCKNVLQKFKTL